MALLLETKWCPHYGNISKMRKITTARYHSACTHVEKNANAIKMQKMAESLLDNRSRDMWAESHKIKGRNNNLPCSIDGA